MNCKQIDELLPLYAGRDLDEKRARLVSEHVQICSACARVAGEYREAVELAQHFVPPVFTENVYASVRRQVMQQIEGEPNAQLLPQLFGSWFRPRIVWAAASALIIGLGFFALYLIVNRQPDVQQVADKHPSVNRDQDGSKSTAAPATTPSKTVSKGHSESKRRNVRSVMNQPPLVATKSRDTSSMAAKVVPKFGDLTKSGSSPAAKPVPDEAPLRVEMQTKDPNIRIIWFTQPNTKPALPNSKGI